MASDTYASNSEQDIDVEGYANERLVFFSDAVIAITAKTSQMQTELDLVWEILLPAFREEALPEDADGHNALLEATAKLTAHPVEKK